MTLNRHHALCSMALHSQHLVYKLGALVQFRYRTYVLYRHCVYTVYIYIYIKALKAVSGPELTPVSHTHSDCKAQGPACTLLYIVLLEGGGGVTLSDM